MQEDTPAYSQGTIDLFDMTPQTVQVEMHVDVKCVKEVEGI